MTHWIWKTAKTSSWQCFGHLDPWIQADLLDFKHSGCWLFAWVYKIDWLLLTLYYWALRRPHQWLQTPPTACRERRDSVYYTKPVGFCSWMSYTTKAHPALQRQSRVRKKRTWGKRRLKKGVTEQNQKGGQDWCYNYAEGRRTTGKRRARPSQPTMAAAKRCRKARPDAVPRSRKTRCALRLVRPWIQAGKPRSVFSRCRRRSRVSAGGLWPCGLSVALLPAALTSASLFCRSSHAGQGSPAERPSFRAEGEDTRGACSHPPRSRARPRLGAMGGSLLSLGCGGACRFPKRCGERPCEASRTAPAGPAEPHTCRPVRR